MGLLFLAALVVQGWLSLAAVSAVVASAVRNRHFTMYRVVAAAALGAAFLVDVAEPFPRPEHSSMDLDSLLTGTFSTFTLALSLGAVAGIVVAVSELGFWIGVEYWSRGFCTEAVREVVEYGRTTLQITKFVGRCLAWNTASASVMKKVGFLQEGCLVRHELREGRYVDQLLFGLVLGDRAQ